MDWRFWLCQLDFAAHFRHPLVTKIITSNVYRYIDKHRLVFANNTQNGVQCSLESYDVTASVSRKMLLISKIFLLVLNTLFAYRLLSPQPASSALPPLSPRSPASSLALPLFLSQSGMHVNEINLMVGLTMDSSSRSND